MRGMFNRFICIALILFVVVITVLTPVACLAAEVGTPVAEALGNVLTDTILPALAVLIGTLAALLMRKITAKLGIEANTQWDIWVKAQAETAVQYAGEMAAKKLKEQKIKLGGNEKLNLAVAQLISNIPELSRDQAEALVHAALARIHGEGATGDQTLTQAQGTYMYETHAVGS